MKIKHALIILVAGLAIGFIGVFLKILFYSYADTLLAYGLVLQLIGGLLFLYKVITHPRFKKFLNS